MRLGVDFARRNHHIVRSATLKSAYGEVHSMQRKIVFVVLLAVSIVSLVYGTFFRKILVYDNLEKFERLKNIGIAIKVPGYEQGSQSFEVQSQWFTEPEVVNAMTFDGISRYKDGRLISNYPDLKMLKGRMPCPT